MERIKSAALRKLHVLKHSAEIKHPNAPLSVLKYSKLTAQLFRTCIIATMNLDVEPSVQNLEDILNSLCLTGKVECSSSTNKSGEVTKECRLVNSFLDEDHGSVITQTPCGLCTLTDQCGVGNVISPLTCKYMNDTLEGLEYLDW